MTKQLAHSEELAEIQNLLGGRIKKARRDKGITEQELANGIGVTVNYISELERGIKKNPSLKVIYGMSKVLDHPAARFFEK